jgi:hypothetical protein
MPLRVLGHEQRSPNAKRMPEKKERDEKQTDPVGVPLNRRGPTGAGVNRRYLGSR